MKEISELDKAELKVELRRVFREVGLVGAYQIIYELLLSINLMLDVIDEETKHENI